MLRIDLLVVKICEKFKICELRGGEEIVYLSTCSNEVGKLLSLDGELFYFLFYFFSFSLSYPLLLIKTFNKIITKKKKILSL